jgi:hypothetical protein
MNWVYRLGLRCAIVAAPVIACGVIQAGEAVAPAAQEAGGAAAVEPAEQGFRGNVTETMDAGRYTYVRVEKGGQGIWAAALKFDVKVGDEIIVPIGMPMKDFESPTLKRKFDLIYFVSEVVKPGEEKAPMALPAGHVPIGKPGAALPEGHPQIGAGAAGPMAGMAAPAAAGDAQISGIVKETMEAGRYTYILVHTAAGADVWAAAPKCDVAVGDKVAMPEGMPMKDFASTSLTRKFERIHFVGSVEVEKAAQGAPAAAPAK